MSSAFCFLLLSLIATTPPPCHNSLCNAICYTAVMKTGMQMSILHTCSVIPRRHNVGHPFFFPSCSHTWGDNAIMPWDAMYWCR